MTTTAWAHLPSAAHIDRVLASLKKNPEKWNVAQDAARDAARGAEWGAEWVAARDAARDAARGAEWGAEWVAARDAARDAEWDAAWDAAWNAIIALIARDDCAHMLELPEAELKLLRAAGDEQAILLSGAANALKETS